MIPAFCNWLSNTPVSLAIQDALWVIPTVQTVHILAIATVMASVVMVDFRLLGVAGRSQSLPDVAHRYLPWIWCAVVVLLCSGTILIIGEPGRELLSEVFWVKMSLLLCALAVTGVIQYAVNRGTQFWERRRVIACVTAVASLLLWVGILAAGRWIAYMAHG
ncbi:MAG TPA: DUF6644 family protein [Steroidobacteraceae bacterium]|jgi:hypothetical protein|nr:DUF6644 family protein [Steroidobacteraceae bacterium]